MSEPSRPVNVPLTHEQIMFIRDSLAYTAQHFRDHDFGPGMDDVARQRRAEVEAMIASIRTAISEAASTQ